MRRLRSPLPMRETRRATMRSWPLGAAGVLLLCACYRFEPVAATPAMAGADVRLYLTPEGAGRLEPTLGPQTTIVAGRVERGEGDGLSVVMTSTTKSFGATTRWVGERVTIPVADIARTERRVLDRRRSLLAGAGVALAAAAGFALLRAIDGGGAEGGEPGPIVTP